MSSRQLRKLQQQRELEIAQHAEQHADESEDSDSAAKPAMKARPNLFAALGGADEDDDADEQDDDDDYDDDQGVGTPLGRTTEEVAGGDEPVTSATKSVKNKTKTKKKKKNKNKKNKTSAGAKTDTHAEDDEDEIDRAIRQLELEPRHATEGGGVAQPGEDSAAGPRRRMNELLGVKTHHLRAANEMRSLFGREVMEAAGAEEQQQQQQQQQGQAGRRRQRGPAQVDLETFLREPAGAQKLPEVSLRRNVFVQGREHWPRESAGGLTMTAVGRSADGLAVEYAYVHERDYDAMQGLFFACVQIGDPMRMVHLLKRVPYHVSVLLQVSSVAKQDQNNALAAELLERALFTFGRVTTSAFRQDVEDGRARLDFRRPENRQFWLAGHHYLLSLVRKGTYRTALEWAKLLYALDDSDPYAMRHYIHALALRAREPAWLMDFTALSDLLGGHPGDEYLRQSLVLAKLQVGDEQAARELLETGLRRLPWLYCALFQELGLDAPPSVWGISPTTDARSFWVNMYVRQTRDLWNNAQATALLRQVALSQDRADASRLPAEDPPVDLGSVRLAYLDGQTALLAVAPRHLLDSQPNYEFDPLPPPEHDNIFTSEATRLPWRERHQSPGRTDDPAARWQNFQVGDGPANRGGAPGAVGMMNHILGGDLDEDHDTDDDDLLALRTSDDEELRRDLAAHADWSNEPGILGTMMRMLGIVVDGPSEGEEERGEEGEEEGEEEEQQQEEEEQGGEETQGRQHHHNGLPGAWPEGDA